MKKMVALSLLALVAACGSTGEPASPGLPPVVQPTPWEPTPSETPTPTPVEQDSGSTQDAGSSSDASQDANDYLPKMQAECIAICEREHKVGASLAAEIDKCWAEKCDPACTHDMVATGVLYTPAAGDCVEPVKTPGQACSDCTAANCCAAWDGTFGHPDGKALNLCVGECYTKFPK